MRFGDYLRMAEDLSLNEAISGPELIQLGKTISDAIDNEHALKNTTLIRDITKNPQLVAIDKATGADAGAGFFPEKMLKNLATNYKFYFGKIANQFKDAEAILFEFPDFQTFIVYLGFLEDGRKLAAFAVPPYYYHAGVRKKGIASAFPKITMILKQFGFKVHVQGDQEELTSDPNDLEFINKMVGIFRFLSSRYASLPISADNWQIAKTGFHKLQQEMPEQYQNYVKRLKGAYPGGIMARRKIDIPDGMILKTTKGEDIRVDKAAHEGVEVYYPNRGIMSQWTEDSMDPKTMDAALGSGSGTPYLFRGRVPGDKIVYSQRILPTGLSQLMVEGEMIVDHMPGSPGGKPPPVDTDIICTVKEMDQYQWQDVQEASRMSRRRR